MFKNLMSLMFGDRVFGDHSGVYLRCGYKRKLKKIGEADSLERHVGLKTQLRDMGCWGCSKMGAGCWGPQIAEVRR